MTVDERTRGGVGVGEAPLYLHFVASETGPEPDAAWPADWPDRLEEEWGGPLSDDLGDLDRTDRAVVVFADETGGLVLDRRAVEVASGAPADPVTEDAPAEEPAWPQDDPPSEQETARCGVDYCDFDLADCPEDCCASRCEADCDPDCNSDARRSSTPAEPAAGVWAIALPLAEELVVLAGGAVVIAITQAEWERSSRQILLMMQSLRDGADAARAGIAVALERLVRRIDPCALVDTLPSTTVATTDGVGTWFAELTVCSNGVRTSFAPRYLTVPGATGGRRVDLLLSIRNVGAMPVVATAPSARTGSRSATAPPGSLLSHTFRDLMPIVEVAGAAIYLGPREYLLVAWPF